MNIKRTITVWLVFVLMGSASVQAQTFSEWFRQKKTQEKYLLQQIVALQIYIGYARKGYKIAKDGLNLISDLKKGEVNLHSDYFTSLDDVNPHVKEYTHIPKIMALQLMMVKEHQQVLKQLRQDKIFSEGELDHLSEVFNRILDGSSAILDQLIAVTADGPLKMTDDARLERIDVLYGRMMGHYTFFKGFKQECISLAIARFKETGEVQGINKWYNQNQN